MSNPASLLLAQLHAWNRSNKPAAGARGTDAPDNDDAWIRHRLAVRHLDAIDQILAEMAAQGKSVTVYESAFKTWTQIVFAYPAGWGQANSGHIDQTALEKLDMLAGRLDDFLPTSDEAGRGRTRKLVEEVQAALKTDESIPADMKIHLRQVAEQLSWCLDHYELTGDFELKDAIDRLLISVGITAQKSRQGSLWTKLVNTFVYPFITSTSAQLTGHSILMLTTGAS